MQTFTVIAAVIAAVIACMLSFVHAYVSSCAFQCDAFASSLVYALHCQGICMLFFVIVHESSCAFNWHCYRTISLLWCICFSWSLHTNHYVLSIVTVYMLPLSSHSSHGKYVFDCKRIYVLSFGIELESLCVLFITLGSFCMCRHYLGTACHRNRFIIYISVPATKA